MDVDETSHSWEWKTSGHDHWLDGMIKHVYGGGGNQPVGHRGHLLLDSLTLETLDDYIDKELKKAYAALPSISSGDRGIFGPDKIIFDVTSNVGSLVIDRDRLGLSSQSNFSSIRANCCVYKGKWQYELMLGSKGVMQVGWATINCKFSQEKGVGDTQDSYAYDGNRVRKWNVATYKYGEAWLTGDVIGCTIDLNKGAVHFYRNGNCLGEAFSNVRMGPGMAYFPAVSLAYNENLVANFGATPFRYPVDGYSPLQEQPDKEVVEAQKLFSWLEKITQLYNNTHKEKHDSNSTVLVLKSWPPQLRQGTKAQILLITAPLMHRLGPLLSSAFITESCLQAFMFKLLDKDASDSTKPSINALLELLWALLEPHELSQCLEYLVVALLTGYRFSPTTVGFQHQKRYLLLTLAILQHSATRHYLLQNVLFDKIKFPVFLEVKPLDNVTLSQVVPTVWLDLGQEMLTGEDIRKKIAYQKSCTQLKLVVEEVERIQLDILIQLFNGSDFYQGQTSRSIFLSKFRDFLKENSGGSRVPVVHLCPLPVALAFFHRLISLLRFYISIAGHDVNDLTVPPHIFCDNTINYLEVQRVGGLQSHLLKTFQDVLSQVTNKQAVNKEKRSVAGKMQKLDGTTCGIMSQLENRDDYLEMIELMDGIIRLYQIAAHRQLEKMCSLRDSMQEYMTAYQETEKRVSLAEAADAKMDPDLLQTKQVFLEKLTEQGRHLAWISSVVYSLDRQADVYWLLQVLLRSLSEASASGSVFAFVPDFYVEACIKCSNALRSFFPPVSALEDLPGYQDTLTQYGKFLACHFADPRVVNAELKDSLVQALAAYVCYPTTLQALENMDVQSRTIMAKALLQPYENRAWAQSNWILIRLWKGCGFAFRYSVPPHLAKRINSNPKLLSETSTSNHQKPCPSVLFLEHISEWLLGNPDAGASFISSVLSQLNWAFSEFIGMLQEIQNASNRPERVFIDPRQLKICATCFDLALGLLRVLEMTVHLVPQLFCDPSKPSSDIFLTRLCQLICQVLNRVTSRSGCFYLVVSMEIPGLETVDHFPIVSAVTGILVSLMMEGPSTSQDRALSALLSEPSFQPSSLDFLLGGGADSNLTSNKPFTLRDFEEVSAEEVQKVENLLHLLHSRYKIAQQNKSQEDIDEEKICTICYASPKTALFHPCMHQSCRSCISLHLLNHRECFFCKALIDQVETTSGDSLFPTASK